MLAGSYMSQYFPGGVKWMVRVWERNHQEKRILGARMLVEKIDCHVGDISRG